MTVSNFRVNHSNITFDGKMDHLHQCFLIFANISVLLWTMCLSHESKEEKSTSSHHSSSMATLYRSLPRTHWGSLFSVCGYTSAPQSTAFGV